MNSLKQISTEVESLLSLKNLVEVYEEMAASRMQKVRGAVLQSRQFEDGLLEVFKKVKLAYQKQKLKDRSKHRGSNGKAVAIFVSANSGLYGEIVGKVFEEFTKFVQQTKCEAVVLGKLGISMMADRLPGTLYNYFDFSDEGIDEGGFEMVMRYLIQFEKIYVFYGQFKSILNQEAKMLPVSGDILEEPGAGEQPLSGQSDFLFEPSVIAVATVFEGEILASMFEQALHESQLAKFASRMLSLDRSVDNIEKRLLAIKVLERKMKHQQINKSQLGVLSGMTLWR